jgi:tRNA-splicing ligase RtcB
VRAGSERGLAEEAPFADRDVDQVVAACQQAGLAAQVARLPPARSSGHPPQSDPGAAGSVLSGRRIRQAGVYAVPMEVTRRFVVVAGGLVAFAGGLLQAGRPPSVTTAHGPAALSAAAARPSLLVLEDLLHGNRMVTS